MEKIIINGGQKLHGKVNISGSKNASLPILISTLLTDSPCMVENVPELKDIDTAVSLLEYFGKKIKRKKNIIEIFHNKKNISLEAPYELIKKMRASFLVSGPLLARYKNIKVSLPGGCAIGVRPVNIHLSGFEKLGANIQLEKGYLILKTSKLSGNNIYLKFPSVGATENLIMASVLAKGNTIITNCAKEPEIVDLCNFLNLLGADIRGGGTNKIYISGVKNLNGTKYKVIPDRIEAGTYLIATALTKGDVLVENCIPEHISLLISKLRQSGCQLNIKKNSIRITLEHQPKPVSITTETYPGFPTDLQAQWMVLMCIAKGKSVIRESVFENRFLHVAELQRLGANLNIDGDKVIVNGPTKLSGAPVMVSDLRAGAALVLAGLIARGKTTISHIYHLDRGYECFEEKLHKIGAHIKRINSDI